MAENAESLHEELVSINAAISSLLRGDRITRFDVTTGEGKRTYEYANVTVENLMAERARIQSMLSFLEETEPKFRSSVNYLSWRKI